MPYKKKALVSSGDALIVSINGGRWRDDPRKTPWGRGVIEHQGLRGDRHYLRHDGMWHLSLLAVESITFLNRLFHLRDTTVELAPGRLGENFTVQGLGMLGKIPIGAQLTIDDAVLLEVVEYMQPNICRAIDNPTADEQLARTKGGTLALRGLYTRIVKGEGKVLFAARPPTITVELP